MDATAYDAVLLVSFGGPEGPADVAPFLQSMLAGRELSDERLRELAEPYEFFEGQSPGNAATRTLLQSLIAELNAHGPDLPVYWGNRHWHPLLADTLQAMADDGVQRALALVTSAFGSYPGCRQYLEAIEQARQEVGPNAPAVDKLRLFYNHPGFIDAVADRATAALETLAPDVRPGAKLIFTAHSLPVAMAAKSPYEKQLQEACRLVAEKLDRTDWLLAYQSRSALSSQPWLEPEVGNTLVELRSTGECPAVVLVPIGFVLEHKETVYDLDIEMGSLAEHLGLPLARAATVGNHPRFVQMARLLIEERLTDTPTALAMGTHGPAPDVCRPDCCLPG